MTEPLKPMTVAECDEFDARLIPGEPLPSCDVRCIDRLLADHAKMRNALRRAWLRYAANRTFFCDDHSITEADGIAWVIFQQGEDESWRV